MVRAILLYAIVIVAVPIAIFRPFTGLLIYLWISFGRPGDFVWREYKIDYIVFVAAACLVGYLFSEINKSPIRLKGMVLLLMLWLWLALASVAAFDPYLAYPKLWEYSRGFTMAFLTAALTTSEKRVRDIFYVLAVSLGLLGAKGALDGFLTGFASTLKGPGGMISEQNEYALALNMAIPILVWLARIESRKWVRLAFFIMAIGCAITVVGTWSRSGLLGLIMAGLLLLIFSKRKLIVSIIAIGGFLAFLAVAPRGALQRYSTIPTAAESDASAIGRLQAWDAAIHMTRAHPVLGVGLRNFVLVFPRYSNAEPRVTHNAIFEMMSETGIPGCMLFLAMVLATISEMFRLWLKARGNPETQRLAVYCLIVMTCLIVYLVPNMFINRQDFDLMYQFIAVGAGLAAVTRKSLVAHKVEEKVLLAEVEMPLWQRAQG